MSANLRNSLLVGFGAFVLYVVTQAPGLFYTDVGELAAACKTWGVAHPTGYPLFTLVGHVWTLLPWPSVIKGLNILVAIFTAAATGLMVTVSYRLVRHVIKNISDLTASVISVATASLFAVGTVVWSQSTALEVYALNLLLLTALLLEIVALFTDTKRFVIHTVLTGLIFGFMLANHLSSVFLLPGIVVLCYNREFKSIRHFKWLFTPMLLGPSLYILLPIRSAQLPPINWGMVHRGFAEFLYHVKGTQFGVWMFSDEKAFRHNAELFMSFVSTDFVWIGWIIILTGLIVLYSRSKILALGLGLLCAGNLGISLGYAIPDIDSYFLPTLTVFTLFFAVGMSWFSTRFLKANAVYITVFIPLIALSLHFKEMDYSKHRAVESYTKWALDNAEKNAIIISRQWDYLCSATWYLQTVEHYRTDVAIIDKELLRRTWYPPYLLQRYPDVMKGAQPQIDAYMPWLKSFETDFDSFMADRNNAQQIQLRFVDLLNAIIENNPGKPIYITPEIMEEEKGFAVGYQAIPVGPLFRLTKDTSFSVGTNLEYVHNVTTSLAHRTSRLDSALSQTVLGSLYNDARYALDTRKDTAAFKQIRADAIALNPHSRISGILSDRIP